MCTDLLGCRLKSGSLLKSTPGGRRSLPSTSLNRVMGLEEGVLDVFICSSDYRG
jgi:hypothetical protein